MFRLGAWAMLLVLIISSALVAPEVAEADDEVETDINMVVALDRSESISLEEASQQIVGLVYALRDPRLTTSIENGWHGRIAITIVTWSSFGKSDVLLPWRLLADQDAILTLADDLEGFLTDPPLLVDGSQTDLALGIRSAGKELQSAPYPSLRQVINIVSDGISNIGNVPNVARDKAVNDGVVINALTMGRGSAIPVLRRYFERNVIGGPSAFVHNADSPDEFSHAMLRKMLLEIALLNERI